MSGYFRAKMELDQLRLAVGEGEYPQAVMNEIVQRSEELYEFLFEMYGVAGGAERELFKRVDSPDFKALYDALFRFNKPLG